MMGFWQELMEGFPEITVKLNCGTYRRVIESREKRQSRETELVRAWTGKPGWLYSVVP